MQFTTVIAALATLAASANAAALRRDGARLAQFRIFGAEGCKEQNEGFYTVDQSDADACHQLGENIHSVNLEYLNLPTANGCTLNIYTDADCSVGKIATALNVCNNPTAATEAFGSWNIVC